MWKFLYNTSGDKKINESINVIEKDEKHIYAILQKNNKSDKTFFFLVLDMQTGKEISNKIIDSISPETAENITHYYSYGNSVDNSKTFMTKSCLLEEIMPLISSMDLCDWLLKRKTLISTSNF